MMMIMVVMMVVVVFPLNLKFMLPSTFMARSIIRLPDRIPPVNL